MDANKATTLLDLPSDLLAYIFGSLQETEQKSFFLCCKHIRWDPHVLAKISRATLSLFRPSDRLRGFPRGATLRKLAVHGSSSPSSLKEELHDFRHLLANVQELELLDSGQEKAISVLLSLCPNVVHINACKQRVLFLTECMANAPELPHLKSVHIRKLGRQAPGKPIGKAPLRKAVQAIESKFGRVNWKIEAVSFLEGAPVSVLVHAMQGSALACGVEWIEVKKLPSPHESDLLRDVFPDAKATLMEDKYEFPLSVYDDLIESAT